MKSVCSSSGQYQVFLPFFLSFFNFIFISCFLYFFFFSFFFSPKSNLYNSKCLPVWVCSPHLQNRRSPNPEPGTDIPLAHSIFFPLALPELVPGTRQGNILFCPIAAHDTLLALPWTPRPGGQQDSGLGTPTVSWSPLPVQQSSSGPYLERERSFDGMFQASSSPCPHLKVLQMFNLY